MAVCPSTGRVTVPVGLVAHTSPEVVKCNADSTGKNAAGEAAAAVNLLFSVRPASKSLYTSDGDAFQGSCTLPLNGNYLHFGLLCN